MVPVFNIAVFDQLDSVSRDWPRGATSEHGARYHPFQSVIFLKVWTDSFGRSGRRSLHFVEVRDGGGRPVFFVPLCITMRNGAKVLEFIDANAADYNAPILFPTTIVWSRTLVERLWLAIVSKLPSFDVLVFSKMPSDIDGLANPLSLIADRANDISCHANDLRRPWPEIEAGVPQRKTLFRKIRNLEKVAPLEFRIATEEHERREATDAFLRQKQWRFEQTRVPGFDVDVDKRDFFHEGTHVFAREGMLKLFYLTSGEEIIATMWGLMAGRRYYAIMLSFEAGKWAKFSPGGVLYYRTLRWLHEHQFEWLDLGIGDEPWKLESCETTFRLTAKQLPVTLQGRVFLARQRLAGAIRSTALWQAVRPLKWIILRRLKQMTMTLTGYGAVTDLLLPMAVAF
ncbi:GNAT family N-acetyltransferase [Rhizobium terrae]|uniref:GNAT family N-acetyltransferase n=1 Tax=Rhizobium terrae TaxID=2171756 RepID=UPI0013C37AB3|nr:GNAT family N-acetyltransferase [Rhizobium terrae]